MTSIQVFLILLSGLGVLHGLLLAVFLWTYGKGYFLSNRLLSVLLLVLSFRIGKSVLLEFVDGIYYQLIFIGLASLLLIGPLFYFYTRSVLNRAYILGKADLVQLLPFITALAFGAWVNEVNVKSTPTIVFVIMFIIYYGHYLIYLLLSYRLIRASAYDNEQKPVVLQWLYLLLFALSLIWVAYVLNIVEDKVPYILGPVLYSVIAYGVSFIALKKGYNTLIQDKKYKTTPLSDQELNEIYKRLHKLVISDKLFKDPNVSLKTLSSLMNVSSQKISMVINIKYKTNFNSFINHHRIKQAEVLFRDASFSNFTIAFIAYEIGFSSLTSFNAAFKKEMQKTPSVYRKEVTLQ